MNAENIKFEQYKQLLSQLAALRSARESSNQFWVIVNTIGLTAVSYIRDLGKEDSLQIKATVVVLFVLGTVLSILWFTTLMSYKKSMDSVGNQILGFETDYKSIVLSKSYKEKIGKKTIRFPAAISEACIPICFIMSYMLLGLILGF
jgi:hypothetical protein